MMNAMPESDRKLKIVVLFGGRSGEHEVSLDSARSVLDVLDPMKYEVFQVGITHEGAWLTGKDAWTAMKNEDTEHLVHCTILPDPSKSGLQVERQTEYGPILEHLTDIDVVFPVLHGTYGEDGTLQGLLEMADLPYVGAGVTGSSVGMDKGIFKEVMRAIGIPTVESVILLRSEIEQDIESALRRAEAVAGYPLFAKPANLGSSVGITKCNNRADLSEGIMEAATFDRRVLVERGVVDAREIEVSVLGNDKPEASVPGEVLPSREFYSYESKYVDGTSGLLIPAPIPAETAEKIRRMAVEAYKAIDCAGMARVDFFLEKTSGEVYLNELNTIPGFTSISMYPKLWEATSLPYARLVERLIDLALDRKADRDRTEHRFRRILMTTKTASSRSELLRQRRDSKKNPTQPSTRRTTRRDAQAGLPCPDGLPARRSSPDSSTNPSSSNRQETGSESRTGRMGTVRNSRSRPERKSYDVAFSLGGTDVRAPVLTIPRLGPRWVSGGLTLLLVFILYTLWTASTFTVSAAEVSGIERLTSADIYSGLGVGGQPIFKAVPAQIEKQLRTAFPDLASVKVQVKFPNHVAVQVIERMPVLIWYQDGKTTWIDTNGIAFMPRGEVEGLVPVASTGSPSGITPDPKKSFFDQVFIQPEMVKAIMALAPHIPQGISMTYDPQYGMGWQDPRGWSVYFGPEYSRYSK